MTWTVVQKTWTTAEVVTAAMLNQYLRDQLAETAPAKVTTAGDLVYASGANALARLAIGTAGQTMRVASALPAWGRPGSTIDFEWSGDISPAQITSNQNDYNPTGLSTATVLRLSTDASRNLTSIAGGFDGRVLLLKNVGSFDLVLKNDDGATGTAANRFSLAADVTVTTKTSVLLWYDSTLSRWTLAGGSGAGGGGAGGTPALTFGTSNTDGASGQFVETDAAIAIFDATAPTTQAFGDSAAVGSAAFAARRDHKHGFPTQSGGATAFFFHDDDLTASGTSVAMNRPGDTGLTEIVMPYAGSIVAVSVRCQNARTAGTATFKPTVNGTESSTLSAVLNGTDTQSAYGTQASGVDTFTAGQRVGVKVTTDGSWAAGATPSVDVEVFILPAVSPPTGLSTASSNLSGSDVTLTNANQYYDIVSVSLAAGTWLIIAGVTCTYSPGAAHFTAKVWDGTTVANSGQMTTGAAGYRAHISVAAIVTPSSTTTYKVSVATNAATAVVEKAAANNGAGDNASYIKAIRVA